MTIPFLGENRIVNPTLDDLLSLLLVNDAEMPPSLESMDTDTAKRLREMDTGPIALVYKGKSQGTDYLQCQQLFCNFSFFSYSDDIDINLDLVGWKGKSSVRAYVPKNERIHYLRLVGGDTSKYEKNKFEEKRKLEEAANKDTEIKPVDEPAKEENGDENDGETESGS